MKKLLTAYGLDRSKKYYDLIALNWTRGDKKPAKVMFLDMPRNNRKEFINCNLGNPKSTLDHCALAVFIAIL